MDEDADPDFEEMVGGLSFFLSSVGHSGSLVKSGHRGTLEELFVQVDKIWA